MNVANPTHSCPEKLTTSQPPRPKAAHCLRTVASASGREGFFQADDQEPSAVNAIAPQDISADGSCGWPGADGSLFGGM